MTCVELPGAFGDLAPYLDWALPTERARRIKRGASSMDELNAFYAAMVARMEDVLSFLGEFPPENPPADVERLFFMAASLAEIAPAIEMYGEQSALGLDVLRLTPVDIYPTDR